VFLCVCSKMRQWLLPFSKGGEPRGKGKGLERSHLVQAAGAFASQKAYPGAKGRHSRARNLLPGAGALQPPTTLQGGPCPRAQARQRGMYATPCLFATHQLTSNHAHTTSSRAPALPSRENASQGAAHGSVAATTAAAAAAGPNVSRAAPPCAPPRRRHRPHSSA